MIKRVLFGLAAMLIVPLCAAQARPRDDVMAGLYRCNGLDSDRQWLDCYYGAAQPARTALGLVPALPGQVRLAQSSPAGSLVPPSEVRSRVIAGAGTCYDKPADRDWLDCYYRAAQPMREQLGLSAPVSQSVRPAPAIASFGVSRPVDDAPANRIMSRMTAYSFDAHRIFTVTLANGQIWRQIESDTDAARWKKAPASYLVTIRRGMSGSFILTVRDEPHSFRVRRIS
jgi:hypothetical protein